MGAEADIIAYLFGRYFGLRAFGIALVMPSVLLACRSTGTLFMVQDSIDSLLYCAACCMLHRNALAVWYYSPDFGPYRFAVDAEEGPRLEAGSST